MEVVLLLLFTGAVYGVIGYVSTNPFREWCRFFIKTDHELANAVGTLLAALWPIGWPTLVIVGLYYAGWMVCDLLLKNLQVVWASFKVIVDRLKLLSSGEQ